MRRGFAMTSYEMASETCTSLRVEIMRITRRLVLTGTLLTVATFVACGSNGENLDSVPLPATAERAPSVQATATPQLELPTATAVDSTAESPVESQAEAAVRIMNSIFSRDRRVNLGAVVQAGFNGHPGLVPVLVEAAGRTFDPDIALDIARSLEKLTGERIGGDYVLVAPWYTWLGNQPEFDELPGFGLWKGGLYGRIDPAFHDFFYEDVPRTIPLWTVQWGGVVKDGIPPLENPLTITADRASYLLPDELVFGVVINGEARAYPHRIMGWHEMANDVLGGKPISVVF